jgi:hypothetical protein
MLVQRVVVNDGASPRPKQREPLSSAAKEIRSQEISIKKIRRPGGQKFLGLPFF